MTVDMTHMPMRMAGDNDPDVRLERDGPWPRTAYVRICVRGVV